MNHCDRTYSISIQYRVLQEYRIVQKRYVSLGVYYLHITVTKFIDILYVKIHEN